MKEHLIGRILTYCYKGNKTRLTFIILFVLFALFLASIPTFTNISTAFAEEFADEAIYLPEDKEPGSIIWETRSVSRTLIIEPDVYAKDNAAVSELFANTLPFEEDGFSGSLALQELQYEPSFRIEERQIERAKRFSGLPEADVVYLSRTQTFEIASEEGIGATQMAELEMTAVTWITEAFDSAGRPTGYTAEVTYRGVECVLLYDYFTVTAVYNGEVSKVETSSSVLEQEPLELTAAPIPLTRVEEGTAFPLAPFAAAASSIVLLGVLALVLFFRSWNIRLIEIGSNGSAKIVMRKRLRFVDGQARLTIPDSCELRSSMAEHVLRAKRSLVDKGGILLVIWRGYQLLQVPLEGEIAIQQQVFDAMASTEISDLVVEGIKGESV